MGFQPPREPRQGQPLDWAWGAQVTRYLRSITPRSSPTVKISSLADGTTFTSAPASLGRNGDDWPFDIAIGDVGGTLYATFRAGTINGLLPSNYATGVAVPASGTKYLVLSCTANNGEITAAAFAADAAQPGAIVPLAGQPPTTFKLLIGLSIDATPVKIWGNGNIQAIGKETFRLQKAVATAGQLPYDVYYTWDFSLL